MNEEKWVRTVSDLMKVDRRWLSRPPSLRLLQLPWASFTPQGTLSRPSASSHINMEGQELLTSHTKISWWVKDLYLENSSNKRKSPSENEEDTCVSFVAGTLAIARTCRLTWGYTPVRNRSTVYTAHTALHSRGTSRCTPSPNTKWIGSPSRTLLGPLVMKSHPPGIYQGRRRSPKVLLVGMSSGHTVMSILFTVKVS